MTANSSGWARMLAVVIAALVPLFHAAADESNSRPNALFIAVDDLRPQLGCYLRARSDDNAQHRCPGSTWHGISASLLSSGDLSGKQGSRAERIAPRHDRSSHKRRRRFSQNVASAPHPAAAVQNVDAQIGRVLTDLVKQMLARLDSRWPKPVPPPAKSPK